jgi:2-keto-4-pentenoate hydratase
VSSSAGADAARRRFGDLLSDHGAGMRYPLSRRRPAQRLHVNWEEIDMSEDRLDGIAARLVAARQQGARISLSAVQTPKDFEEGFAIQERVVPALKSPIIGWKVMPVANGPVIYAPILDAGRVGANATWTVLGPEPAGLELEIAFRLGRSVAPEASAEQVLDAVAAAHVVFELCQSRIADPARLPRHVMLADCIANAGLVVGPEIAGWRETDLKARPGRLLVDGTVHAQGHSVDPIAALLLLPPAMARRGRRIEVGQFVITGSLIGMNWLTGRHDLKGVIEDCGEVAMSLVAA